MGGYTNHADAFRKAILVFATRRSKSAQYIIMVTDGEPTWEQGNEFGYADQLKGQGVIIIMIGNNLDITIIFYLLL